jgi:hypothetical protein
MKQRARDHEIRRDGKASSEHRMKHGRICGSCLYISSQAEAAFAWLCYGVCGSGFKLGGKRASGRYIGLQSCIGRSEAIAKEQAKPSG